LAKIAFVSLGCAKNLVDTEQMMSALETAGHEILPDIDNTDIVVINTCGFIESAKTEAIEEILEVAKLKAEGRVGAIIVAGCLVERYREELMTELPEVDAIVGCGAFLEIGQAVDAVLAKEKKAVFGDLNAPIKGQSRMLTTPPYMAYLKVAEGCDNHCAYCVIPSLRGKYRSRTVEDVLDEAEGLAEYGVKELIVIAQDTSRYGTDLYGKRMLPELLKKLADIKGIEWIRLHYLYPDEIDDELIDTIASLPKVLHYFDIPIQHVSDHLLESMNRRGDGKYLGELFKKLRTKIPDCVIRTSIIVGLPGETKDDFVKLCDFLKKHKLERAGVFAYSAEEGTLAAEMPDQVPEELKQRRLEIVTDLQSRVMNDYNERCMGKTLRVLCEGFDRYAECWFGRTYADSPDVDGKVFFSSSQKIREGTFVDVVIEDTLDGDLVGSIVE